MKQWSEIMKNITMLSQLGLCTLLVCHFQDRHWRMDLHSGIFLRDGRIGHCGIQVLSFCQQTGKKEIQEIKSIF